MVLSIPNGFKETPGQSQLGLISESRPSVRVANLKQVALLKDHMGKGISTYWVHTAVEFFLKEEISREPFQMWKINHLIFLSDSAWQASLCIHHLILYAFLWAQTEIVQKSNYQYKWGIFKLS